MTPRRNIYRWLLVLGLFLQIACAYGMNTLTVLNFQNRTPENGYDWLQRAFPDMLLTHFVQHGQFTVVEREQMQALLDELKLAQAGITGQEDAAKFAGVAKVQKVVYGHYSVEHDRLSVTAFIFDASQKTVDAVATATGEVNSLCDIEHELFANLLGRLGSPLTEQEESRLLCVVSSSLSAAGHFYDGLGEFDAGHYPEALGQFQQARDKDPQYGEARFWTARMYSLLGEDQQAVLELHRLITDFPNHPLIPQTRMRAGVILMEELGLPRLAVAEFEKLVAMEPDLCVSPSKLRQAHWDEYLTLFRQDSWRLILDDMAARTTKTRYSWSSKPIQPENLQLYSPPPHALEREADLRAKHFNIYVEAWYRLGQCREELGDALKAFQAYDQGRAICRWLLLNRSELTGKLYNATYDQYRKLLLMDKFELPIPDWVWPIESNEVRNISQANSDQVCRYLLTIFANQDYGALLLMAPKGQEFNSVSFSTWTDSSVRSSSNVSCGVTDFARPEFVFPHKSEIKTNGYSCTVEPSKPWDYRVAEVSANGYYHLNPIFVSATFRPWTAIHHPKHSLNSYVVIHPDPTAASVLIDGQKPRLDNLGGVNLSTGTHQIVTIADYRTNTIVLQCQTNTDYQVYPAVNNPWQDTGIRLPKGRHPNLCRAADGQYWLVYVPDNNKGILHSIPIVYPANDNSVEEIWMMKSRDLHDWSTPVRLPSNINASRMTTQPQLMLLSDGRMQLVFVSDRRQSSDLGIYISQTSDGRNWSAPRRIADRVANDNVQGVPQMAMDSEGRDWLFWPNRKGFSLSHSADGLNWSDSFTTAFDYLMRQHLDEKGFDVYQWRQFQPQLSILPDNRMVATAKIWFETRGTGNRGSGLTNLVNLTYSLINGQSWQLHSEVKPFDKQAPDDFAMTLDHRLVTVPKPKLYDNLYSMFMLGHFSNVLQTSPNSYAIVACGLPSGALMAVYTATAEDLRPFSKEISP